VADLTRPEPKTRHPSTLKTEVLVWLVAVGIGLGAGLWSAVTSPSSEPLGRSVQSLALSAMHTAGPEAAPATTDEPPRSASDDVPGWALGFIVAFLRRAWWVLPIPILFSFWRQSRTTAVCHSCGSPQLAEILTPHGPLPPRR